MKHFDENIHWLIKTIITKLTRDSIPLILFLSYKVIWIRKVIFTEMKRFIRLTCIKTPSGKMGVSTLFKYYWIQLNTNTLMKYYIVKCLILK